MSVSEMIRFDEQADKPCVMSKKAYREGLMVFRLKSNERIVRYGKSNKFTHDEIAVTKKRRQERIINLYIGTPEDGTPHI